MTTPQEPLVMTLEEANETLLDDGWMIRPSGNGTRPWELVEVTFAPRHDIGLFYTWEEAAEIAVGRPVVARDDDAELRAAADQAHDAIVGVLVYQHHVLSNPNKVALNRAANHLRAVLAATEGQP